MSVKCKFCPLRKRDVFEPFTDADLRAMERFKVGELTVDPGTPLLMEGSVSPQLFTVLEGVGLRHKSLVNGRRHVVNFVFPGDFLGLQAGLMGEMKHSVEARSHMTLCVFNRTDLWAFFNANPARAFDLTWLAAVEEHFLGEALLSLGQRKASERVAWALVKLFERLASVGMVTGGRSAPLPFRQQDLADALGLSLVHTNRTLVGLRERQIAQWSEGRLHVNDLAALRKMALLDPKGDGPVQRPLM